MKVEGSMTGRLSYDKWAARRERWAKWKAEQAAKRKSIVQVEREAKPEPMDKQALVDLLFDVQVGNCSCRWAAEHIINVGVIKHD